MSMVDRFKKERDGFQKLLELVETSPEHKRKNFMRIVATEDPRWGSLLRSKIITIKRFLLWDDETVKLVIAQVPLKILVAAVKDYDPSTIEKAKKHLPEIKKQDFDWEMQQESDDAMSDSDSARIYITSKIREMIKSGYIKLEEVDPGLIVREAA